MSFYRAKHLFMEGKTNEGLVELAKSLEDMETKLKYIEAEVHSIKSSL
jgi:hypothetical protein